MGEAIGQLLPLAVAIAIFPIPIIAVVVLLATPRGRVNGPAFVLGWIVGLAAVGTIVLVLAGDGAHTATGGPSKGVGWLRVAIGIGLIVLGLSKLRRRPRGDAPGEFPAWMRALEGFRWPKAVGAGLVLAAGNPKNLLLVAAGASYIAQASLTTGGEAATLAIFVLIGTLGVAAPVALFFVLGDRSREILEGLRGWLAANSAVIVAILLIVIGVVILGDAITGLSL